MSSDRPTFECANCHAEINHEVTFHVGVAFCCAGCVADGPCTCSYDEVASHAPARIVAEPAVADDAGRLVLAAG